MQHLTGRVLSDVVNVYLLLLVARAIIDFVLSVNRGARPPGALIPVFELVYTVTDPPLRALRRVIPPLRIGNVALDLGFTVLFVALLVIQRTVLTRV